MITTPTRPMTFIVVDENAEPVEDAYGELVTPVEMTAVELPIYAVAPAGSSEVHGVAMNVRYEHDLEVLAPAETCRAVSEHDVAIIGGEKFEVTGRPFVYDSPFGFNPGGVIRVKSVVGA